MAAESRVDVFSSENRTNIPVYPLDVFVVTEEGTAQLKAGATRLPAEALEVLVLLDGKATVGDLEHQCPHLRAAPSSIILAPFMQTLPAGIRSRVIDGINGLSMNILEAGYEQPGRPCLLLLHGFPELAFSWRKVMLPFAQAGYHVVAPDQRGYGSTTGWDARYDGDLASFRLLNLVRDALGLVFALGYRRVAGLVGHDFGSPVAAWCAMVRPDVFPAAVLMSAPFAGAPSIPFNTANDAAAAAPAPGFFGAIPVDDLAKLPRPRKHYQWYYSTREADADMRLCPQGIQVFLRAYYHVKSADWKANRPFPLASWSAQEFAKLPTYYVMDRDRNMAETVAPDMPSAAEVAACGWLSDAELGVYAEAFARTGFQGGLQWYRCATSAQFAPELQVYAGHSIDVPSMFVAGRSDWGPFQKPGDLEKMQGAACTRMTGCHFIDGAGHWVQQEQPEATSRLVLEFLSRHAARS